MRAMVLCAGLGTRFRPLTEKWPKPAMPLLGQPLFRYHLAVLKGAGVTEVGINTHHLGDTMHAVASAECARSGLSLTRVHEEILQGTDGGIRDVRDFLAGGNGPFVIFNGDILFPLDLGAVVRAHRDSGAAATMVLLPMPEGEKYAAVEVDKSFEVRKIAGHGPGGPGLSPWHFTGVHVMEPSVFDFMAKEGAEDINRDVYPRLMAKSLRIRGHVVKNYWSDLGTPSRYLATVQHLLARQTQDETLGADSPFVLAGQGVGNFFAHRSASVRGKVAGPAYFAERAVLSEGARVGGGVSLEKGAVARDGSRINRAVVMDDTEIGAGEELVEVIAWREHRIPAPL